MNLNNGPALRRSPPLPGRATRVYIASPGSLPVGGVADNVRRSIDAANELMEADIAPFVPLLSHFWHFATPHPYERWLWLDFEWVSACDVLLRLPGESRGADREVARAQQLAIPVFYSVADVLSWEEASDE